MARRVLGDSTDDLAGFLAAGGEMRERLLAFDWASTALGPAAGWPRFLKVAARTMLESPRPTSLFLGSDFIWLYNDAQIPLLGERHPAAFAQPAARAWPQFWERLAVDVAAAMEECRATSTRAQPLLVRHDDVSEERNFSFSHRAISEGPGAAGGVMCAALDQTTRVLAERRQNALHALRRARGDAKDVEPNGDSDGPMPGERRRLAAVLHDSLQPLLLAAKVQVSLARERGGAELARAEALLDQAFQASRSLLHQLDVAAPDDAAPGRGARFVLRVPMPDEGRG